MRSCRRFLAGIPHLRAGHPCLTHPSATPLPLLLRGQARTFDLHVLGTPPAFILSQDQTRHPVYLKNLSMETQFHLVKYPVPKGRGFYSLVQAVGFF